MKLIHSTFFLLATLSITTFSQNLDSLFTEFLEMKNPNQKKNIEYSSEEVKKCGLPLINAIQSNFEKFTKTQQNTITALLTPNEMQESIVSPSGFFRIHYDITGIHAIDYDVHELAKALDSSYTFEVDILGYPAPPTSASIFNENKYDVFVRNLGINYGQTVSVNEIIPGSRKYDSYIDMDNDFSNFNTTGIEAARVTAAHELHHAIQMGGYINKYSTDGYYYELTSTAMEDFVFEDINDYHYYISSYFNKPYVSFPSFNHPRYGGEGIGGYEIALWNIYLKEKFEDESPTKGFDIIKRSWEMMPNKPAMNCIASAVEEFGESFKHTFNDFGVWTYFTNHRADSDKYFDDADQYPLIKYLMKTNYIPPSRTVMVESEPVSNNFLFYLSNNEGFSDTIYAIITNADVTATNDPESGNLHFDYTIQAEESPNSKTIVVDKYYSVLTSSQNDRLTDANIFNNFHIDNGGIVRTEIDYVYPQPFKHGVHSFVGIPVAPNELKLADLYIYSSSMNLLYSSKTKIFETDKIVVHWNALDDKGEKVPTGVYIYVTNSNDNIKKGKIVILNE